MATITTTTQTDVVAFPSNAPIARDSTTGYLYALVQTAAGTLTLYRSTNTGTSWASYASFTHASLAEWSSVIVDKNKYLHIAYRVSTGTADTIHYRRCNLSGASGVWSSALQLSSTDANGGVAGSVWQGVDLAVVRHANGSYAIAVCGAYTMGSTKYGIYVMGVSITAAGTIYVNNGIITGNRAFWTTGTAPGRAGVSCELEHNGDGFTSSAPHLWISWGRTTARVVKLAWAGTFVGWRGPSGFTVLRTGLTAHDYVSTRWDGTRWMTAMVNPDDATEILVYERNRANTGHTILTTPAHPTGNVQEIALSYDAKDKGLRVYATGTSTTVLYFIDYLRTSSTWTSWATVSATAVLGSGGVEFGVRAGGTTGNARFDVVTAHSGAPNSIVHTAQTASSTPNIATWDTSAVPYVNGGAADVAASLLLDWTFTDPDPGDTQGSYAVSRQVGAGAVTYWRASDSTWQATEQQNVSGTTSLTLAASWAAATDATHTFKVKVWDAAGTPAAGYSAPLMVTPSAKVNPAITAPVAAAVIGTSSVTVTWTAAEQTQRRIRLLTNPGGVQVFDSGWATTSDLSYTIPYVLANSTGWTIELTTRNNEGLTSTAQTRNFTVSYTLPATPTLVVTAVPLSGWINVAITNPAPGGGQPVVASQDLYRRKAGTTDSVLVVAGLASGASYQDWTAVGSTAYEYQVVSTGTTGAVTSSAWTS